MAKVDFLLALDTLSSTRVRRFTSTLPIWLHFDGDRRELQLMEERGAVRASVPAQGTWPPAGATVDLFMLKRTVKTCPGDAVELHAAADSLLVFGDRWHARLKLLGFGPKRGKGALASLPLFDWADRRDP